MIIGHGDIASVLKDLLETKQHHRDKVFFAAGVSNSGETKETEYQREEIVLMQQDKNKHLVYFGSLSIFYSNTRYARHKRHMETLVKRHFKHYTIVRMGNITWGKNPHTIINYFRNQLKKGKPLKIQDTHRYLVTKKEFLHWIEMIPNWNCEMNITGERLKVEHIVKRYVSKSKRK